MHGPFSVSRDAEFGAEFIHKEKKGYIDTGEPMKGTFGVQASFNIRAYTHTSRTFLSGSQEQYFIVIPFMTLLIELL